MNITGLMIDIETRSRCNLKTQGNYKYAADPSTEIICVSWTAFNDQQTSKTYVEWVLNEGKMSDMFMKIYKNPDVELYAHNATFERLTMNVTGKCRDVFHGFSTLKPDRWVDTQHSCKYLNLPPSLNNISECLNLTDSKLDIGKSLISKYSSPRKDGSFADPTEAKDDWLKYCRIDNKAQMEVLKNLGTPPEIEKELYRLDARMNDFGIPIDVEFCEKAVAVIKKAQEMFSQRIKKLTGGIGPSQAVKLKEWFNKNGCDVEGTGAEVLTQAYRHQDLSPVVKQVIELKIQAAKASVKKFNAALKLVTPGDRIRGMLNFCGAATTGRWSAAGVQPQNFPNGGKTGGAIQLDAGWMSIADQEQDLLKLTTEQYCDKYGDDVLNSISYLCRSMIKAPEGYEFLVADYSAIEARVIAWLCSQEDALEVFREGKCAYKAFAATVFGLDPDEAQAMDKHDWRRAVCKEGVLSLGYGTGHESYGGKVFERTDEEVDIRCKCPKPRKGKQIHTCEAKRIVDTYRTDMSKITATWKAVEMAVIQAYKKPKTPVRINKYLSVVYTSGILRIILPSKRMISYPGFELELQDNDGYTKLSMHYRGKSTFKKTNEENEDPNYRSWWRKKHLYAAKFLQNICQAVARDVMAEAMFRVQGTKGMRNCFTVHDECIVLVKKGLYTAEQLCDLMAVVPSWAKGLPLKVEGGTAERYCK